MLNNPQVDVSVAEFNSQKIVISGSFSNVGTVPVMTVPQTLLIVNANPFGEKGLRSLEI